MKSLLILFLILVLCSCEDKKQTPRYVIIANDTLEKDTLAIIFDNGNIFMKGYQRSRHSISGHRDTIRNIFIHTFYADSSGRKNIQLIETLNP